MPDTDRNQRQASCERPEWKRWKIPRPLNPPPLSLLHKRPSTRLHRNATRLQSYTECLLWLSLNGSCRLCRSRQQHDRVGRHRAGVGESQAVITWVHVSLLLIGCQHHLLVCIYLGPMTFIFFGNYLGQQQLFICIYLGPVTFILLIGASDIFYTFIDFRPAIFIHTYFIWGQLHFFLHVFISGQRHLFTFIHLEPATLVYVYLFASTDF